MKEDNTQNLLIALKNNFFNQREHVTEKNNHKVKSQFIFDILDYTVKKKPDDSFRERLFKLISNEVGKFSDLDNEVLARLDRLEIGFADIEKMGLKQIEAPEEIVERKIEQGDTATSNPNDNNIIMYHDPSFISLYLLKFKENTDLKWTTHPWDENKYATIEDFIQSINDSKEYSKLFQNNRNLYNLIRYFIYNPKVEVEKGIPKFGWPNFPGLKIGWQFPNNLLIDWCKKEYDNQAENEMRYPFSYVLPKELQPKSPIKGIIVKTFENVVDIFKTEIQFRENYFSTELKKRRNKLIDYSFSGLEKFSNLEFYTYTSGVLAAIDNILNQIRKNETNKEILFDYHVKEKVLTIDITHINSYPFNRPLDPNNLSHFLGGGLYAIAENLFSICDFSIISKFLDSNKNEIAGELCITFEGTEGEAKGRNISIVTPPKFKSFNAEIFGFTYRLKFPL